MELAKISAQLDAWNCVSFASGAVAVDQNSPADVEIAPAVAKDSTVPS